MFIWWNQQKKKKKMKKIDLHGIRHNEVKRVVENFIYQHLQDGTKEIEIVTGQSLEMKQLVKEIAEDYNMTAKDVWGNFGSMVIDMT